MLDAPELQDDFYLNLVDWSAQNVLAVGLGSCVYLWSACTSQVSLMTITFFCLNVKHEKYIILSGNRAFFLLSMLSVVD